MFVVIRLYQARPVLLVEFALPIHSRVIRLLIDKRRGIAIAVYPPVLQINTVIRQIKIGLVLPIIRRARLMLIIGLVLIRHTQHKQMISDQTFAQALYLLSLQRANLIRLYIL